MAVGIEGLAPELAQFFQFAGAPNAYDRIGRELIAAIDEPWLADVLAGAWAERSFEASYARPLLALAALRYRALLDGDHPLAPELLMDADAPDLAARLRAAFDDPGLGPVLASRSVQTNEPGRAWGWGLTALVLGLEHRRFGLVDLGCSAGLNLVVDRTAIPYRLGVKQIAGFDFPSPESRLGLDEAPIDASDDAAARWLRACIWPGHSDRIQRFEAARKIYAQRWPGEAPPPARSSRTRSAPASRARTSRRSRPRPARTSCWPSSRWCAYLPDAARAAYEAELCRTSSRRIASASGPCSRRAPTRRARARRRRWISPSTACAAASA
ncbi:MAG: DUF2332 family protein [Myxococcota bacterium]